AHLRASPRHGAPLWPPPTGTSLFPYTTLFRSDCPTACALPPVMPPVTTGAPHVYRVPPGTIVVPLFTGVTVNVSPLQISVVRSGISGVGFTVTTSSNVSPTQ